MRDLTGELHDSPEAPDPRTMRRAVDAALPAMLADARELVGCEPPSADLAAVACSAEVVARVGARRLGVASAEVLVRQGRTHLRWRLGEGPRRVPVLGALIGSTGSRSGSARRAAHRHVGDAVLQEGGTGRHEAEPGVPALEVRLRVEHQHASPVVGDDRRHQGTGQAAPAGGRHRDDPSDPPLTTAVEQHPQVGPHRLTTRAGGPPVLGGRLEVAPVELGVGAALLDDEHVDAQADDGVGQRRVELVPGGRAPQRRAQRVGRSCRETELMQYRWSVGVGKPSPSKTCPRWEPQLAHRTSTLFMPIERSVMSSTLSPSDGW